MKVDQWIACSPEEQACVTAILDPIPSADDSPWLEFSGNDAVIIDAKMQLPQLRALVSVLEALERLNQASQE